MGWDGDLVVLLLRNVRLRRVRKEWDDTSVDPLLPERARSECARSRVGVGPIGLPFQERRGGERQASLEGSFGRMMVARYAVQGNLGHSPKREVQRIERPSSGLTARLGKSIAKQSEGRAGEKHLPVGGPDEKVARYRESTRLPFLLPVLVI